MTLSNRIFARHKMMQQLIFSPVRAVSTVSFQQYYHIALTFSSLIS